MKKSELEIFWKKVKSKMLKTFLPRIGHFGFFIMVFGARGNAQNFPANPNHARD